MRSPHIREFCMLRSNQPHLFWALGHLFCPRHQQGLHPSLSWMRTRIKLPEETLKVHAEFFVLLSSLFFFFFPHRFSFFLFCILGCTGSSLLHRLSLDVMSKGYSSFRCSGFLLPWFLLLSTGCRCEGFGSCSLQNLEHSLSKLCRWVQLLRSMQNLPRPGIQPVSPALAARFLSTVPLGKSYPVCSILLDNVFSATALKLLPKSTL